MNTNPLKELEALGQSLWLDYIRRDLIASGGLRRLIEEDGLHGITSNPAIFEKAIVESHDYDQEIEQMAGKPPKEIYEVLSQADVRSAADAFRAVYDRTDGRDGYVSLEVDPRLAHDTTGTIDEARRLWKAVDRPNVFIKIPATLEGLQAIRQSISEGININVTLLFGLPRYREVAEAYMAGLEDRIAQGRPVSRVASVASFFLSRIDLLVDPVFEKLIAEGSGQAKKAQGQVAIASAKMAYLIYREIIAGERFKSLAAEGARAQRLLWASTSTKNPAYSDIKYVEALIGPETINTLPMETIDAYRDHGHPEVRLDRNIDVARGILEHLSELEVNIDHITQQLEDEGIEKFSKPFEKLLGTLANQSARVRGV